MEGGPSQLDLFDPKPALEKWSGKPLPRSLTNIMHIGNQGGNATNTRILIPIFDGGKKAVGLSIPRDDYVQMYGTYGFGGWAEIGGLDGQ